MKLNGTKNIITDRDITITEGTHLGETLSKVLESQQGDINELRSNLKWIYKYGGVGSGMGGGGGSSSGGSSNWVVLSTIGGKSFNTGDVLALTPGQTDYTLFVQIKGGSGEYILNWNCGSYEGFNEVLNASNNWSFSRKFKLKSNGLVSITVTDNVQTITKEANYVVNPYSFGEIQFYRGNRHEDGSISLGSIYVDTDIFFEDVDSGGLYAVCSYDVNVDATVKYRWFNNMDYTVHEYVPIEDRKGNLIFELASLENKLDKSKAGVYTMELSVDVKTETGDSEVITRKKEFNLIPQNVYIRLLPASDREQFYDTPITEGDFYKYKANKTVAFIAKAYFGNNGMRNCSYTLKYHCLSDLSVEGQITNNSKKEQEDVILSFVPTKEGWYKVDISVVLGGSFNEVTKYVYCAEVKSSYNWYYQNNGYLYSSGAQIGESKYFRINPTNSNFGWSNQIIMTNSSNAKKLNLSFSKSEDFVINIGVQYNSINDPKNPIVSFMGSHETPNIVVYQNKIEFQNILNTPDSCEIFIRKSSDYDSGNNYDDVNGHLKSHLVTIVWTKVKIENQRYYTYQGYVYVDGILSGATKSFSSGSCNFTSCTFHPGNYNINLFEITYLDSNNLYSFNDIDAVYYYNTYLENVSGELLDESEFEMISIMYDTQSPGFNSEGRTFNLSNNLLLLDSGLHNDIARRSKIPTLVFETTAKIAKHDVLTLDWLNTCYTKENGEGQVDIEVPVTLYWSNGQSDVEKVLYPDDFSEFTIQIQGSSTKDRKAKNLTLKAHTDLDGFTPLFSPNYVKSDASTFLPEQEFTLKADMVDSSHSNNTSIGKFVNQYNNFEYSIEQDVTPEIKSHVRKCLEGFPVLVFLNIINTEGTDQCYYLGIYNFNLGRGSHFNLGYSDLRQLEDVEDVSGNAFTFKLVDSTDVRNNIAVAEIQNNRKYWDFSQYDQSVLFPLYDGEDANFMFGDIVCSTADKGRVKEWIQNFVKSVAKAGGYIFESIGKTLIDLNNDSGDTLTAYRTVGTVPSYKTQYKRISESSYDVTTPCDAAVQSDLEMCVSGNVDDGKLPYLNLDSAAYYYTTCMVFALVDSVQKNLNIKSWNGRTFGLFFYDMDTSLGVDNNGNNISYYCFSDYWKSNVETTYDDDGNEVNLNKGVIILRDYVPPETHEWYDTPSSYVFAIPKYISVVDKDNSTDNTPQNIYTSWRTVGGILESADKFIDEVFSRNLMAASPCLVNLNYRNKYLYSIEDSALKDVSIFKGTRIEKTREWLTGRLRILDGYFNLSGLNVPIYIEDENYVSGTATKYTSSGYIEPRPTRSVNGNPDVYITKDIFAEGETSVKMSAGTFDFTVNSEDFSPLLILNGDQTTRYLLSDSTKNYSFRFDSNANSNMNFGGSKLWRSIDTVNSMINCWPNSQPFYLNSDKIKVVVADNNREFTNDWNLTLPAAEQLRLTGPNYKGLVKIGPSFYNLMNIDISNSGLSLEINNTPSLKQVDLKRINSKKISIVDNLPIEKFYLDNATIETLEIKPYWIKNFTLQPNMNVTELSIYGPGDDNTGTLTIKDNRSIVNLEFKDFKNLVISDCPKLKSIICNDVSGVLNRISVVNCPNVTHFEAPIDNVTSIDLSGCTSLSSITLKGDSIDTFDKLVSLDLSSTQVTSIEYRITGNSDAESDHHTEYLDLTKFPNLSIDTSHYFDIKQNSEVRQIKFLNRFETPVILSKKFEFCTSLERVYGHVAVNTTALFSGCSKFSIHGDVTKNKWQNQTILNGSKVKTPYAILNKLASATTNEDLFQVGDGLVTNLSMHSTNATSLFSSTACSLFDIYYFFSNCTNVVVCSNTFYQLKDEYGYNKFDWNNTPPKELFLRTPDITNLDWCFRGTSPTSSIKLLSPTVKNGVVTADDGLFSPLVKLESITGIFYDCDCYFDRYLFRRKDGKYPIKSINYFSPKILVDSAESLTSVPDIKTTSLTAAQSWGDFTDFFADINGNITEIQIFCNTGVLNYDTIKNLPETITSYKKCFVSSYGCGTIIPQKLFATKENVKEILNSFVINPGGNTNTNLTNVYATLYLNNSTFSGFNSLEVIGFGGDGDYRVDDSSYSSFCGSGIKKIINESGTFPFDIFKNTGSSNLKQLNCIFYNATVANGIVYRDLKLPETIFNELSSLENVSGMFHNLDIEYTLSNGKPFKDCPKISNVSYLFAQDDTKIFPKVSGSISREFFNHGEKLVKLPLARYWANTKLETPQEDGSVLIEYPDSFDLEEFEYYYKQVNNNISNMNYCFKHVRLTPYINEESELEVNSEYYPGRYYSSDRSSWFEGVKPVDNHLYTEIWTFDGVNHCDGSGYESLDNFDENVNSVGCVVPSGAEKISADAHYFAPPDLLRYCKPNCTIIGLFANAGVTGWSKNYNGGHAIHSFGIQGRICPYMLKPVSDITDISELFVGCKSLSYYIEEGKAYVIPKDFFSYAKNISNLRYAFSDMLFPGNVDIKIFDGLKRTLDISRIFYKSYWDGTAALPVYIDQTFRTNEVSSTERAFSPVPDWKSTSTDYVVKQYVQFNKVFKSKYNNIGNANSEVYVETFAGYSKDTVQHETEKTLVDNATVNNYTYWEK